MHPIDSYIVKVSARCNLACTYCYEFFAHDQSWKTRTKAMSIDTALIVGQRIAEHASMHDLRDVEVLLHGGEPLLLATKGLNEIIDAILKGANQRVDISFGLQTNGLLISPEILDWSVQRNISIGVSCDGPTQVADLKRIDHHGSGSSKRLESVLRILKGHPQFSGLLCVIEPDSNPIEIWKYLSSWSPPMVDFLLPHHTWENPPYDISLTNNAPYGEWLCMIFDEWMLNGPQEISIRYFEEIMARSMGGAGTLESLGEEPVTLLVINVDGEYEGVDSLKASLPGAWITNMNVHSNSIQEVLVNELISLRQSGASQLSSECIECCYRKPCGGGYMPHRYHSKRGFLAPSVYCKDIMYLISHIHNVMSVDLLS